MAALACHLPVSAVAYDVTDKLSFEVTGTGVYQYGDFKDTDSLIDEKGSGAVVVDLLGDFHPTDRDQFQVILSYASGNALNDEAAQAGFTLAPFADDLEDDLRDINGRNRDTLLTAWYKHTFGNENSSSGLTGGIIDSTAYLDDNAFANDELAQFMNDIFVNNTLLNLPSYDIGAAVELDSGKWHVRGVAMNSLTGPEDQGGRSYNYYGAQFGYTYKSPGGNEGNYRIIAYTTTKDFANATGTAFEPLRGVGISVDQAFSEKLGLFARLGWQDDDAAVDHKAVYSIGLAVSGIRKAKDTAGVGIALLDGADNSGLDDTVAFEGYVKFQLGEYADVSFDIQYMEKCGLSAPGLTRISDPPAGLCCLCFFQRARARGFCSA
jgi:porin